MSESFGNNRSEGVYQESILLNSVSYFIYTEFLYRDLIDPITKIFPPSTSRPKETPHCKLLDRFVTLKRRVSPLREDLSTKETDK